MSLSQLSSFITMTPTARDDDDEKIYLPPTPMELVNSHFSSSM
jgi:hypothetical protein